MPLSPDLFKRLSALNRRRPAGEPTTGAQPSDAARTHDGGVEVLEQLIPGQEREAFGGRYYLVRRGVETFIPQAAGGHADPRDALARYRHVVCGAGRSVLPDDLHESLGPLITAPPAGLVYLDIEACGLAGEPVFLVGLLREHDGRLEVHQFLARDYAEEGPMLAGVWQTLASAACLVTYNGRTFDLPTVGARSAACGLFDLPSVPDHVDLLPEARRRWRTVLPNCRLQTVERALCARRRRGDIPGHDIPAAYHEFVRSRHGGDARRRRRSLRRLQTILHHNALDLLTLADLVVHILSGGD